MGSPSSQSSSSSLAAALVGGPWPAGVKRRWMARLLGAVAPRGVCVCFVYVKGGVVCDGIIGWQPSVHG